MIPKDAEELLKHLLTEDNPVEYAETLFENADNRIDQRLRAMFRSLKADGFINTMWADDVPYYIEFEEKAYKFQSNGYRQENTSQTVINMSGGKLNYDSIDNSVTTNNITITNSDEKVFAELLEKANCIENNEEILQAINGLKQSYGKPSFKEKVSSFLQTAANSMTIFSPFIPALIEMTTKINM